MRKIEPKPDAPSAMRRRFPDPNDVVKELGFPNPFSENYGILEQVLWLLMATERICNQPWMSVEEIYDGATDWLQVSLKNKKSIVRALARAGNRVIPKRVEGVTIYKFARPAEKHLRELAQKQVAEKKTSKKKPMATYDWHDRVKDVSLKQFQDGHYKEAIQNALVEVIDQVKVRANHPVRENHGRRTEYDGDDLMNHVFGCDNQSPKIKFNALQTGLDKAEQRGFMNLFKGIVGVRDKKAHLNFIQNDKNKAVEYLCLASLLIRLLEEGTVIADPLPTL
jgi:uncharacterized protein (TIGR02391 family)